MVPGNRVEFEALPDGRVTISKFGHGAESYAQRIARARGMAKSLDGMTTDEIMLMLRGEAD